MAPLLLIIGGVAIIGLVIKVFLFPAKLMVNSTLKSLSAISSISSDSTTHRDYNNAYARVRQLEQHLLMLTKEKEAAEEWLTSLQSGMPANKFDKQNDTHKSLVASAGPNTTLTPTNPDYEASPHGDDAFCQASRTQARNANIGLRKDSTLTEMSANICSDCGNALSDKMKFCPICGNKTNISPEIGTTASKLTTELTCNKCGRVLSEKMKFCPSCGSPRS